MKKEIIDMHRGDLGDIRNVRPAIAGVTTLDGNWICKVRVLDSAGIEAVAERTVTTKITDSDGNERFECAVLPSESETLTVGAGEESTDYNWVIQLSNSALTPPFVKERHITLRVSAQGITP